MVAGQDGDDVEIQLLEGRRYIMCHPDEIQLWWPNLGAFNVPEVGGLLLERQLRRQWRRSLYPRHIDVKVPGRWQLHGVNPHARVLGWRQVDATTVAAIEAAAYPRNADEALSWLSDETPTVALNRQLMFVRTSVPDLVNVYYGMDLAGHIANGAFNSTASGAKARRVAKIIGGIS
jgi:hypothetical protein